MPSKRGSSQSTGRSGNNGASYPLPPFVSCELSDEQKKFVKAHVPPMEQLLDAVDKWVRDGFKLSIRYDERSSAVLVTLTGPTSDSDCAGLALSSRGPSLHAALAVLSYKHFEVLAEDWRTAGTSNAGR